MMRRLVKGLAVGSAMLVFIITLLLNWPLPLLGAWLEDALPDTVQWQGARGHLLEGELTRLTLDQQGALPVEFGPVSWHATWPGRLILTLGTPPHAWTLQATPDGRAIDWRLQGGALTAIDTSGWPAAPAGIWQGTLQLTTRGQRCLAAQGSLTSAELSLLTPDPIPLGQGRLQLVCDERGDFRWQLTLEDPPGLSLQAVMTMHATGGEGRIAGELAPEHPLAPWWRLIRPDAEGRAVQASLGW